MKGGGVGGGGGSPVNPQVSNCPENDRADEDEIAREDYQDYWISRREALGPAFGSFPSWSYKTP